MDQLLEELMNEYKTSRMNKWTNAKLNLEDIHIWISFFLKLSVAKNSIIMQNIFYERKMNQPRYQ